MWEGAQTEGIGPKTIASKSIGTKPIGSKPISRQNLLDDKDIGNEYNLNQFLPSEDSFNPRNYFTSCKNALKSGFSDKICE